MTEILKAEKLVRAYKSGSETLYAVHDVSFSIGTGKLTVIRGRSGSGKTTLLNLLGAMDMPTSGEIWFDGQEITGLSEAKRDGLRRKSMGFVFQTGGLMSFMSAYENVDFGLRIAGDTSSAKQRKERVEACLSMVGLAKRMNHKPTEMSGGEQQRVAIARAFVHSPKIIFADEPTSELDTAMGLQVVKVFKDMIAKEGTTVVMTSHDPGMVEVADFVVTLQDGEIVDE